MSNCQAIANFRPHIGRQHTVQSVSSDRQIWMEGMYDRIIESTAHSTAEQSIDNEDHNEAHDGAEGEWYQHYLEQQRRMLCPGCGDEAGPY
jgi:hypothetical protein